MITLYIKQGRRYIVDRWSEVEVLTIVPISPCDSCGQYDQRHRGGLRLHGFRSDPRVGYIAGAPNTESGAGEE